VAFIYLVPEVQNDAAINSCDSAHALTPVRNCSKIIIASEVEVLESQVMAFSTFYTKSKLTLCGEDDSK